MKNTLPLALLLPLLTAGAVELALRPDTWRTPDQAGLSAFEHEDFQRAARAFEDPAWRAAALYRAGEFEDCAVLLAGVSGPEAAFNRGNALIFLGRYEEAVASYTASLALRPAWADAEHNRRIAASRIRDPQHGEGTGGMLGSDGAAFDLDADSKGKPVEVTGGRELSDTAMREQWLRSVETRPQDFLRVKFAAQRAAATEEQQ